MPASAAASEAPSSRLPVTGSTASPAILRRSLVGRTSTRTWWPSATSARATAAPTKPVAPVTRIRSPITAPRCALLRSRGPVHRQNARSCASAPFRNPSLFLAVMGTEVVAVEGDAFHHREDLLADLEVQRMPRSPGDACRERRAADVEHQLDHRPFARAERHDASLQHILHAGCARPLAGDRDVAIAHPYTHAAADRQIGPGDREHAA